MKYLNKNDFQDQENSNLEFDLNLDLNVKNLGQVFTSDVMVDFMLSLSKNNGNVLEPSVGNGQFFNKLIRFSKYYAVTGIEIDERHYSSFNKDEINKTNDCATLLNQDFFDFFPQIDAFTKFDTIIGNPPYVKYQDILPSTLKSINDFYSINLEDYKNSNSFLDKKQFEKHLRVKNLFDERSNLYLFFIHKCILHLQKNGELIFVVPREFLKSTSSIKLNEFIYENGTITDFIDLGDGKHFKNASPNCVIFRFEKDNFSRKTNVYSFKENKLINSKIKPKDLFTLNKENLDLTIKDFIFHEGQLCFLDKTKYSVLFSDLFFVKVGAVSGLDSVFKNKYYGNVDFVTSITHKTGNTERMVWFDNQKKDRIFYKDDFFTKPLEMNSRDLIDFNAFNYLKKHKDNLIQRKIKNFTEENWFSWGRKHFESQEKRIYVNCKTRQSNPFFTHQSTYYDGSVLAIFPKKSGLNLSDEQIQEMINLLNDIKWEELGFLCDGRYLFSQKSLENTLLPNVFSKFL